MKTKTKTETKAKTETKTKTKTKIKTETKIKTKARTEEKMGIGKQTGTKNRGECEENVVRSTLLCPLSWGALRAENLIQRKCGISIHARSC